MNEVADVYKREKYQTDFLGSILGLIRKAETTVVSLVI